MQFPLLEIDTKTNVGYFTLENYFNLSSELNHGVNTWGENHC